MPDVAELRAEGEVSLVLLADLDEDIRQGRVPPDAALRYGPWTGDRFVPVQELAELAEAFDTPNARFSEHLSRSGWPRAALAVPGVIAAFGAVQLFVPLPADLAVAARAAVDTAMTGFDAIVLRDRWYSPWTSQLVHANPQHLLSNLLVIAYSGYRAERALGPWGYLSVGAAALLCGATLIALFGTMPVVGSSVLAYGLLAAQLAVGFRFGDVIPASQRRYYGYGNLLLFGVLVSQSAFASGVSHLGHLGGFVGGYVTAMLVQPPLMWPRADRGRATRRAALALGGLLLATALMGPALRALPGLIWGDEREVVCDGVLLRMPARLSGDPRRPSRYTIDGMNAWKASRNTESALFCSLRVLDWDALNHPEMTDPGRAWAGEGERAIPIAAPPPRGPGWTGYAVEIERDGAPTTRVIEHQLLRGRVWLRLGMLLELDASGEPGPEAAVFERVIATAEVGDPPALSAARAEHMRADSPATRLALADALAEVGDLRQADGLYDLVIATNAPESATAAAHRLAMWAQNLAAFDDPADPAWFESWMIDAPTSLALQRDGLRWLVARGRCDVARLHLTRDSEQTPGAPWHADLEEIVRQCGIDD